MFRTQWKISHDHGVRCRSGYHRTYWEDIFGLVNMESHYNTACTCSVCDDGVHSRTYFIHYLRLYVCYRTLELPVSLKIPSPHGHKALISRLCGPWWTWWRIWHTSNLTKGWYSLEEVWSLEECCRKDSNRDGGCCNDKGTDSGISHQWEGSHATFIFLIFCLSVSVVLFATTLKVVVIVAGFY